MNESTAQPLDPRRWRALAFIGLAQLMVVLDGTIVNIALPSAQHDLGISDANRQWVVTAYALAFGGLLLFGGRIADRWGRRRAFIIGLIGFAGASALGGAAVNTGMLLGARALQGAFGAILAPAALSLLTVMFTQPKERAKAFGVYGAISGGGAAIGLILGGALTEYASWRWTLYVNVLFAVVAVAGAIFEIKEPHGSRNTNRLDIPGILLAGSGLASLVYGFSKASTDGWSSSTTLGFIIAAVVLLAAFVFVQARTKAPLLPLRVVLDRNRGGAYLTIGIAVVGMFGAFLFLTYYLQVVLGYSPLKSGLAFLPMVVGMMIGATQVAVRLLPKVPTRALMVPGALIAAAAMLILTQISVGGSYATHVLPALLMLGFGMGLVFMPAMNLATRGVKPQDAGVASAMVSTSQQVGGAIGTSLLSTIANSATANYASSHAAQVHSKADGVQLGLQAMVHGFSVAYWIAGGLLALAALSAGLLINARPQSGGPDVHASGDGTKATEDAPPVFAH
ncbi:MFS transporter [Streptacidiphilus jiangxiensis]|uniref:Drug resistance transporter, EmrB/QacA subfamily n=1 Tax=Streptacidiphilus jiangxiensis TaxID=235985 RepID=A0A1H7V272_STRJI|nr:MFS transporter [Streptacidiphilus jiangxiensis]SEM03018.1 drug resistance transporter, EmrB/QacA subfamily [Streptacidiphilus jiangxiensis]